MSPEKSRPASTSIVLRLVRKDWHFTRHQAMFYLLCGLGALGLMSAGGKGLFYAGTVLLVSALVILGVHPVVTTVIEERKNQTLAFTMSLPISPRDYTWSKLAVNLISFFVPWLILLFGTWAAIAFRPGVPDGLIPIATVLLTVLATNAVLILCVALVSESLDWTVRTLILCNLLFQGLMYAIANYPVTEAAMKVDVVDWSPTVFAMLGALVLVMLAALGTALWLQSRKTDFV